MRDEAEADELSTVTQHRFSPSPLPETAFELHVSGGPDVGAAFALDGAAVSALVGQSPVCDLRLSDRLVSRRHLVCELVIDRVHVKDLGSTNGTFINGVKIVSAFAQDGDVISLGATSIRVEHRGRAKRGVPPTVMRLGKTVGASHEMRRLYPLIERLAGSSVSVVLEGETGTGKEVLAESLHDLGPRAGRPFVVFDCTAVPPNLIESELFGHERGAFTGAVATKKGVFEQADGGTLLIDEIGDLELSLQPKLLRALERGEVKRVGGDQVIKVNVRLLSATRRDLDREVQTGRFRDDLFHRIAVARIELPPLRARRGDVPILARHFATQLGGDPRSLPAALLDRWEDDPWPGNLRELRNRVARWLALGDLDDASSSSPGAPPETPGGATSGGSGDFMDGVVKSGAALVIGRERVAREYERRYIEHVLERFGGNVTHAAEASGIARRHFNRLRAKGKR